MVRFGVLPVVASPDGTLFFFDRRDMARFVEDARWFSSQLREMGATPEELRECWRRMRAVRPRALMK